MRTVTVVLLAVVFLAGCGSNDDQLARRAGKIHASIMKKISNLFIY